MKKFVLFQKFMGMKCYIDANTYTMGVELEEATVYNEGDKIIEVEGSILEEFGKLYKEYL